MVPKVTFWLVGLLMASLLVAPVAAEAALQSDDIVVSPGAVLAGESYTVEGTGFIPGEVIYVVESDSAGAETLVVEVVVDDNGAFVVTIDSLPIPDVYTITAELADYTVLDVESLIVE